MDNNTKIKTRAKSYTYFSEAEKNNIYIYSKVRKFTTCSKKNIITLLDYIRYIYKKGMSGDFVECGVGDGGQIMAMLLAIKENKNGILRYRNVHIYDKLRHRSELPKKPLLRNNIAKIEHNIENIFYNIGLVENTIPKNRHREIALLRIDIKTYTAVLTILEYLFPKLRKDGCLIINNYYNLSECKEAVDDYFINNKITISFKEDHETQISGIKQ